MTSTKFTIAKLPFPSHMGVYQQYIAKSRYAKYLPALKRREHWNETCGRVIEFLSGQPQLQAWTDWQRLYDAMYNLEALPSMRLVMTAGPALARNHIAAYNCAYAPIDSIEYFWESMLILLHGTGVGFSVEPQYVSQLPAVPEDMKWSVEKPFVVPDTKEGWVAALQHLLTQAFYYGNIPAFDVSMIRPKGTPLKTFGGRASGPEPLMKLLQFISFKLYESRGRKLSTADCHDIACMVGEVVVVGGVRRSALISLGGLDDDAHRLLKHGEAWKKKEGQRFLSNNSVVFEHKPTAIRFLQEFTSLASSGTGERGIFNREAAKKQASKWNRRSENIDYGTNPCSEIILRPNQFCNLSTIAVRPEDGLSELLRKNSLATVFGTMQATLTDFKGLNPRWKINTEEERLLGVSMTGVTSNVLTNGTIGMETLKNTLGILRGNARDTNRAWAARFGIRESAAITCIKPEGTASLLLAVEGYGLHPEHDKFFERRVRQSDTDPIVDFLKTQGLVTEPDQIQPEDQIIVLPFAAKGLTTSQLPAIKHLELWKAYQLYYCEHKPSVTISVKEHEWAEVAGWVYENFDIATGIAFLPGKDGHTYVQAPLTSTTEEGYNELLKQTTTQIDWDSFIEDSDQVEGVQTLACTAGGCTIA